MARCPECNAKLVVAPDLERWDRIFCEACGIELEVVDVSPLELEAVYDFEDDDNALDELEEDEDDLLDDLIEEEIEEAEEVEAAEPVARAAAPAAAADGDGAPCGHRLDRIVD